MANNQHIIEIFDDKTGNHRAKIIAPNGEEIFTNGQGVANFKDISQMLMNLIEAIKQDNYKIIRKD